MTPAMGTASVLPVDTSFVFKFDETLSGLSTLILIKSGPYVEGSYKIVGDTLTFTPSVALDPATWYLISPQNVEDLAGNKTPPSSFSFRTQ